MVNRGEFPSISQLNSTWCMFITFGWLDLVALGFVSMHINKPPLCCFFISFRLLSLITHQMHYLLHKNDCLHTIEGESIVNWDSISHSIYFRHRISTQSFCQLYLDSMYSTIYRLWKFEDFRGKRKFRREQFFFFDILFLDLLF